MSASIPLMKAFKPPPVPPSHSQPMPLYSNPPPHTLNVGNSPCSHTTPALVVPPPNPADTEFICYWDRCYLKFDDVELLYEHLCEDHVGRKVLNTLCLECKWEGCSVQKSKRDHITSHVRVHLPLKPFVCKYCDKKFKRAQDVRKHTRKHFEPTVRRKRQPKSRQSRQLLTPPHTFSDLSPNMGSDNSIPQLMSPMSGNSESSSPSVGKEDVTSSFSSFAIFENSLHYGEGQGIREGETWLEPGVSIDGSGLLFENLLGDTVRSKRIKPEYDQNMMQYLDSLATTFPPGTFSGDNFQDISHSTNMDISSITSDPQELYELDHWLSQLCASMHQAGTLSPTFQSTESTKYMNLAPDFHTPTPEGMKEEEKEPISDIDPSIVSGLKEDVFLGAAPGIYSPPNISSSSLFSASPNGPTTVPEPETTTTPQPPVPAPRFIASRFGNSRFMFMKHEAISLSSSEKEEEEKEIDVLGEMFNMISSTPETASKSTFSNVDKDADNDNKPREGVMEEKDTVEANAILSKETLAEELSESLAGLQIGSTDNPESIQGENKEDTRNTRETQLEEQASGEQTGSSGHTNTSADRGETQTVRREPDKTGQEGESESRREEVRKLAENETGSQPSSPAGADRDRFSKHAMLVDRLRKAVTEALQKRKREEA
ncbi:uncharacterized protein VTP21DRAFT_674 [Calcarisporiella thermophila]|uniref:uncharacterized protein n=1 Tax=Calcarisporiella thermophila TaxID=911321 RepID=UPI003743F035